MNRQTPLPKISLFLFSAFLLAAAIVALSRNHQEIPRPADSEIVPPTPRALESTGEDLAARSEWQRRRLSDPSTGKIPADAHIREAAFARTLPNRTYAKSQSHTWQNRGPHNVGGRTRALAIDAANENRILAGGVSGGMWLSNDNGSSWTKTTAPADLHSVTAIAQDTRAGKTNTWYVGTGELRGNSAWGGGNSTFRGDGIFKSTNGGSTWTQLASTADGAPHVFGPWNYVSDIAIDSSNTTQDEVYVARYGGIMRSTDGGVSWAIVRGAGGVASPYTDVAVDDNGVVYAYLESAGSAHPGIWRSADGLSWTNITPAGYPTLFERGEIAISPSNNDHVWVISMTSGATPTDHSLWLYDANAGTWTDHSSELPYDASPGSLTETYTSQINYDMLVEVHPSDDSTIFVGGTNLFRLDTRPASAGYTWVGGYIHLDNSYNFYPNHHPDQHALAFYSNANQMLSGNDGGVHRTTNNMTTGNGSMIWSSLNSGYLNSQFYTICLNDDDADGMIAGGTQDNGTWSTTSTSPTASWVSEWGGDGSYCAIANAAAGGQSRYISAQNGVLTRKLPGPWVIIHPSSATGQLFIHPFALDPTDVTKLFYPAGANIYRSVNAEVATQSAFHWTNLGLTGSFDITALSVSRANAAHVLYYGTSTGKVFRIDNADTVTTAVTPLDITGTGFPSAYVSDVAIDPTDSEKVMVTMSNYSVDSIWYTTDGGSSWTDVEGNLGGVDGPSIRSAALMPGAPMPFLVGTSIGLFAASSVGPSTTWALEGPTEIGNVVVDMVRARMADGLIVVGTHANGVYSSEVSLGVEMAAFDAYDNGGVVEVVWRTASETNNSGFELQYRESIDGAEFRTTEFVPGSGTSSDGQTYRRTVTVGAGKYVFRLKQIDDDGAFQLSDQVELIVAPTDAFELTGVYPNPVTDRGTVTLALKQAADVELALFDATGRRVRILHNGPLASGDKHRFEVNVSNLAAGVYFVRLQSPTFATSTKLTVIN